MSRYLVVGNDLAEVRCRVYKTGVKKPVHEYFGRRGEAYTLYGGTYVTLGKVLSDKITRRKVRVVKYELLFEEKPWGFVIETWTPVKYPPWIINFILRPWHRWRFKRISKNWPQVPKYP